MSQPPEWFTPHTRNGIGCETLRGPSGLFNRTVAIKVLRKGAEFNLWDDRRGTQ
jgi:hypothetical protein